MLGGLPSRLTDRLSYFGESRGIDWLTYNPGMFLRYHRWAVADAPAVIRTLRDVFPEVRRLADVGAGSGAWAAEAARQGLEVEACEHSRLGRWISARQGVRSVPFDLNDAEPAALHGPFDLAICFEVAEHLPPALGDAMVRFLARTAPAVVFTAAPPGQGGTGHINEQPQRYWLERFSSEGMELSPDWTQRVRNGFERVELGAWWLTNNAIVLKRR
jgi:2-polyprenyl-3-methyl-5-hydroxy-6-metoxy-1,4-benzoquinol methylase